ncbi:PglZ domain-containing protein, partial [Listeria monocytogenes]|nr:PglZ domain-containing protein [Listeria monocytogenes]
ARTVLADDQPTNNTTLRGKILEAVGGSAIQAEDFKALNADERRELYKANRVLYVYHNRIDATGDKPGTERQVFEVVD